MLIVLMQIYCLLLAGFYKFPKEARYTFIPLVVHWVGSGDEWSNWELVDGGGSLDCHRNTDTQRAWNCKDYPSVTMGRK